MSCNITTSREFDRSLKKLAKRYRSMKDDFRILLASLHENPRQGVELGGGVRKVRMAIASKGKGKSGGARVITFLIYANTSETELKLITIYDKAERENISDNEIHAILRNNGLR